jgi:hypothetical protein
MYYYYIYYYYYYCHDQFMPLRIIIKISVIVNY